MNENGLHNIKDRNKLCLIPDQTRYIYKKVKKDSLINIETIKQEIEEDRLSKKSNSEEENLCQTKIRKGMEKIKQM